MALRNFPPLLYRRRGGELERARRPRRRISAPRPTRRGCPCATVDRSIERRRHLEVRDRPPFVTSGPARPVPRTLLSTEGRMKGDEARRWQWRFRSRLWRGWGLFPAALGEGTYRIVVSDDFLPAEMSHWLDTILLRGDSRHTAELTARMPSREGEDRDASGAAADPPRRDDHGTVRRLAAHLDDGTADPFPALELELEAILRALAEECDRGSGDPPPRVFGSTDHRPPRKRPRARPVNNNLHSILRFVLRIVCRRCRGR